MKTLIPSLVLTAFLLEPLVAGIESIGGNGRVTIPASWVVTARGSILQARTADGNITLSCSSSPIHPSTWGLDSESRESAIKALGAARVVRHLDAYFGGNAVVDLNTDDMENLHFKIANGMLTGVGGFDVDWTDFSFIYSRRHGVAMALDAGHIYYVEFIANALATAAQQTETVGIVDSLVSTNNIDPSDPFENGGLEDLFIEVNGNTALLTLSVMKSDDLNTWTEAKQVQTSVPVQGGARFFKIQAPRN